MSHRSKVITLGALALTGSLALTGCAGNDPLSSGSDEGSSSKTIVIGSQDYYSNEIISEIYAQALEGEGFTVDRQFRIGQREAYLPEIESGKIDLFPEYTGNLLQYWKPDTTARLADDVYGELQNATPDGLRVLDQSDASDQDSYTVTRQFADQWKLSTINDLANVTVPMTLGANSEAETRPYGPKGLLDTYGITIGFTPIEDAGGPLTVKALKDGDVQIANIYTADPAISADDLVSLTDTKGLFLASHVVPLASDNVNDKAAAIINKVSAAMTTDDLIALNARSVNEGLPASTIASDWLGQQDLN
ncbi:ABC transporter substrate-binding protein [Pseudoclavibacter sp. CFCC 13796]|uniref:ABC transporter substrate-binding protein n=1 Tax=unclassified Pseudoclavibacter TaxID=2615177 RepID=UPI0013017F85|nr:MULTISPECIES: ABC transporter substrate-binding protein [unclassified Pseudoclavibacter]KAB1660698.1 ABC transporter substrate-binding protein [Pseudoclavibacter sp. CFCC 13796]MCD7101164.1 ABC transporter substrate-binding protein [Pseudoclavibacter sp. 13-3]